MDFPSSGEHVEAEQWGQGLSIFQQTMVSGSVDLLKQKLKVVGRNADPIVITLIPRWDDFGSRV